MREFSNVERNSSAAWATLTPSDLIRSVSRRIPSITLTTILVTAIVIGVLIVWPNRYSSDGLMYVRLGRGAVSVDPTSKASQTVSVQETRSAEVLSVREMLASREIAARVVERVGAAEINKPRTWIDHAILNSTTTLTGYLPKSPRDAEGITAEDYEAQIDREEAIEKVQDSISVSVTKNAYTIAVQCKASDPILAQKIVDAVMNEYGEFHVDAHRATGSLAFFEREVADSRERAIQARSLLQETKGKMGWTSEISAEAMLQERITRLEIALDEAESSLAERESRSKVFETRLTMMEEWIPTQVTKGMANNASDTMRTQLYNLEVQENDALSRLKPSHPRYEMLKQMVDESKKIVSDQGDAKEISVEAVNPIRQELETSYEVALAETAGYQSRVDSLASSLAQAKDDLRRLSKDGLELARLTWESSLAEQNFLAHSKSLEESRMLDQLDSNNLSDVSIVQDASLQLKKTGPPRAMLAVVGCMLGLTLGLLQALLRDNPTPSPRPDHPRESGVSGGETRELAGGAAGVRNVPMVASASSTAPVGLPR